ncbi:hypothetical protein Hanom_Chr14g01301641 [Helianthus anomalus]
MGPIWDIYPFQSHFSSIPIHPLHTKQNTKSLKLCYKVPTFQNSLGSRKKDISGCDFLQSPIYPSL